MTYLRNRLTRLAEYLGGLCFWATLAFLILGLVLLLVQPLLAHEPQRVKNRLAENRYFCYDPDELIKQLDMLNHSREIWRPGDRALMTHDLIEIYKICHASKETD